jgi:hypothetical protein
MTMRTILLTVLLLCATATARADVASAARAFADGQAAQLEGDFDHAAQSFELAYSIAPSKEALRSAVRTRQLAGQLARAAMLAEVLRSQYAGDATSVKLANDVIAEARPKLGRITVACTARCTLAVGGKALSTAAAGSHVIYVPGGRQTIEATFDDARSTAREVTAVLGEDVEIHLEPPAVKPPDATAKPKPIDEKPVALPRRAPQRAKGLPPAITYLGAIATVGLLAAGTWSGMDTNKAHDAYVANPTHEAFVAGESKQLRTNLLFGGAIGVGVGTIAIAVLWTRWSSQEAPAVSVAPTAGGGVMTYGARF